MADQPILDKLRALYPRAEVAHAFASTEAGVAFEVADGKQGFPADLIGQERGGVTLRVTDDTLLIRSPRTAARYLGNTADVLADPEGFIDTKDIVERRGDRYHFVGRSDGVINVGGLKVHPEEVETVINRHPSVQMSLVKSRRSPIMGAIVIADVVLAPTAAATGDGAAKALEAEILQACRKTLAWYKVPAVVRIIPSLDVSPSGKLVRRHA
jgi:acyl-coenzyme A synthetase/AMP-(fatty) acid ligase